MSRVVVRTVSPVGLHGFRPGQPALHGLGPGLNVVYAPNAAGKSTLVRGIGLLFSPANCDPDATVAGEIGLDDAPPEVRQVGPKTAPYPAFPGRAETYALDLLGLLAGFRDKDKDDLGKLVGGGFKLSSRPPIRPHGDVKAARTALLGLQSARREKGEVAKVEDGLAGLVREAEAAAEAGAAVAVLDRLLERRAFVAERSEADGRRAEIEARNPGIERQSSGAVPVAQAQAEGVEDARRACDGALAAVLAANPAGALPTAPLSDLDARRLKDALRSLERASGAAKTERAARDRARAEAVRERDAVLRLLPGETVEALPEPTAADVAALRAAAAGEDERRRALLEIEAAQKTAARWAARHEDDGADLQTAADALRDWLAVESEPLPDRRPFLVFGATLLAALAALPVPPAVRVVLALAGVAGAAYVAFALAPPAPSERRGPVRVPGWVEGSPTVPTVVDALRRALLRAARREAGEGLAALAPAAPADSAWESTAAALRLRAADPLLLAEVAASAARYAEALRRFESAERALSEAEREVEGEREAIAAGFAAYGFPVPEAAPEDAAPFFTGWFDRAESIKKAEETLATRQRALSLLLDAEGVPSEDPSGSEDEPPSSAWRLRLLQARAAAAAEHRGLAETLRQLDEEIAKRPPAPDYADATDEEVRAVRADKEALAATHRGLEQAVGSSRATLAAAERQMDLRAKEDAYGKAVAVVEGKAWEMARRSVGARLRAHLAERQRHNLPIIVRTANAHLYRFCDGRFRLEMGPSEGDGLGHLVVCDAQRGTEHRFSALSAGTKVHVVVALRLGLLEENERAAAGHRFPLLADEAMAVSDPESSAAIARTLFDVARDRQVIVFTNGPQDLALFRALEREREEPLVVLTLGAAAPDPLPGVEAPVYRAPHGPARLDLRLAVTAHAARAILPGDHEAATIADALRELEPPLARLVDALERLREGFALSHPRFGWSDVKSQGWASGTKRERVQAIIAECGGCGRRFREAFSKCDGVGPSILGKVDDWLDEHGYRRERPSVEEIRDGARQAFGRGADPFHVEHAVRLFDEAFG